MKMIEAKRVKYNYTSQDSITLALNDVNIVIDKGSFVCIIGHNGSGKSTFAKLLNAFCLPTAGELTVAGLSTTLEENLYKIRRSCGMVFQNPDNQLVAGVVEDDVAFGPENIGLPPAQIRERVDFALKAVNMYDHLHASPSLLSGGQKQRIAIAGVLALNPDILVFDEPTAMLDPAGRREVMEVIHSLNKDEGKTVVLITHHMEEAVDCDRIIVMANGEVLMEGTPAEVFSRNEELAANRLSLPVAAQIFHKLNITGEMPLHLEDAAELICQLLQTT